MAKYLYTVSYNRAYLSESGAPSVKVHSIEGVNKVSAIEHARELLVEHDQVTITKERTR